MRESWGIIEQLEGTLIQDHMRPEASEFESKHKRDARKG